MSLCTAITDRLSLIPDVGEAEDVASDGESDEDSSDDMARFLAFANRSRASGSGLPAALAHLGRAVNSADDEDKETVSMFAVAVASVIKEGERYYLDIPLRPARFTLDLRP